MSKSHNKSKNDILLEMKVKSIIKDQINDTKKNAFEFAIVAMEILSMTILNDKFGVTQEQINQFINYIQENTEILNGDYASIKDYYEALKSEGTITPDMDLIFKAEPAIAAYFDTSNNPSN